MGERPSSVVAATGQTVALTNVKDTLSKLLGYDTKPPGEQLSPQETLALAQANSLVEKVFQGKQFIAAGNYQDPPFNGEAYWEESAVAPVQRLLDDALQAIGLESGDKRTEIIASVKALGVQAYQETQAHFDQTHAAALTASKAAGSAAVASGTGITTP